MPNFKSQIKMVDTSLGGGYNWFKKANGLGKSSPVHLGWGPP
jgi:hypothetical protein